ncbi:hypothetical protein STEG23_033939, partial [Scotinomys teguina]
MNFNGPQKRHALTYKRDVNIPISSEQCTEANEMFVLNLVKTSEDIELKDQNKKTDQERFWGQRNTGNIE